MAHLVPTERTARTVSTVRLVQPDRSDLWVPTVRMARMARLVPTELMEPTVHPVRMVWMARQAQPEVPRVLLTGYADKENAIKAINEVRVFQYVEKPWENEDLRIVLLNALERRNLIKVLTERLTELTTMRRDLSGLRKALVRAFA